MFRLSLIVEERKSGILKTKEMELDYPHSLLLLDNHAPNDLSYTIDTIRTKNVKGSYIITITKVFDIGGFTSNKLTKKDGNETISTKKTKPTYLRGMHQRQVTINNHVMHKFSPLVMYDDKTSIQHIHLGRQILINGTNERESKPALKKKPFPTLLLEKNILFTLEYLDKNSSIKIDNEEIDIYGTLYKE